MLPGAIVTLDPVGKAGCEKGKERPAVIVHSFGPTLLVVPITDSSKKAIPTHHPIPAFNSGTQVKPALATCEHSLAASPARLLRRVGAESLDANDLAGVRRCLGIALGLTPAPTAPPGEPDVKRGEFVEMDFGSQPAPEASGIKWALVLSNDTGNYYGRHYLVAPFSKTPGVSSVELPGAQGYVDLGQLRVADKVRLTANTKRLRASAADLSRVEDGLRAILQ